MKKRICISLLAMTLLVSLAVPAPASAESGATLVANIPFDFYVGGRLVPAGEYKVSRLSPDGSALLVRSADGRESVIAPARAVEADRQDGRRARLTFHRYGGQHFMAAAWAPGADGRALPRSGRERRLRKELRRARSAGDATKAATVEVVTVAARCESN
jgi:hypothetical protein